MFVCTNPASLSPIGGEHSEERVRKRKPRKHRRSRRVIYKRFFIMTYFKNKLNTSKETSPANLDGLGVQGRQKSKFRWSYPGLTFRWLVCALSPRKRLKIKVSFSLPGDQVGWRPDHFWLESWELQWGKLGTASRPLNQPVLRCNHGLCFLA